MDVELRHLRGFEQATGATVSLVRSDDPLAAVEQASIDVAVIRGCASSRW